MKCACACTTHCACTCTFHLSPPSVPFCRRRGSALELPRWAYSRTTARARTTVTMTRSEDEDDAFNYCGRELGRHWEGGRVTDVSDDNAARGGGRRGDDRRQDAQVFQRPPSEPVGRGRQCRRCVLVAAFLHQRLRGRVRRGRQGTAMPDTSHIEKMDWGPNPTINGCEVVPRRPRQRDGQPKPSSSL